MQAILKNIIESFYKKNSGFSARKLSAFQGVGVATIASLAGIFYTIHFQHPELIKFIIVVWLLFALLCLGLVTIPELIKFLNSKSDSNIPQ